MIQGIRWSHGLLIVACVAAIALSVADSASAGTYVIRNCNVPGEARRAIGPWHWDPNAGGNTFGHDECAAGGGFGINAGTMPWGFITGVTMETAGTGVAVRRVKLWLVAKLRSTGSQLFSVVENGNATSATPVDLFTTPGGSTLASPYVSPLLPADTTNYLVLVACSGGTGEPCTALDSDVLNIHGVETTLEETAAPTGSIDGGDLLAGGPQSGTRSLLYAAGDLESGVARVSAIVGNTVAGSLDFTGDCAYAALAACPRTRNGSIPVDTRKLPDGIYPVSLRVIDAAGNDRTVQTPTAIQVANGLTSTAAPSSPGGGLNGASLTALFAANRGTTLTVGYRRKAVIRGRLQSEDGQTIGGARIDVEASGAPGSSAVTTDQDGVFTYTAPRGRTRALTFTYRGASAPVSIRLRLRVKASARLRVSLRGIVVAYGGRVLSTPIPRGGKLVEIQGRAPEGVWKTFATRRTNRRGDFSGTYRLRVHRPGVRLQFRVRIPSEAGYPYVGRTGAAQSLRVR